VTTKEAQEFADQLNIILIETSAKTAVNVDNVFSEVASEIKDKLSQSV